MRFDALSCESEPSSGPSVRTGFSWSMEPFLDRLGAGCPASTRRIVRDQFTHINALQRKRGMVERKLHSVTRHDLVTHQLHMFSGAGPVTAWTIRGEIGRSDRFQSRKQSARFWGLSPGNASSGMRQA